MVKDAVSVQSSLDEVTASSAGGMPFLASYGVSFVAVGAASYFLTREVSALLAMFQGGAALPFALLLERRLGWRRLSKENPLRSLSTLMAISQALALPFLIVAYNIEPGQIPVCLAGLAGVHLLPYGWLQRTPVYIVVAVSVSIGAFALVLFAQKSAYELILLLIGGVYLAAAPLVYANARSLVPPLAHPE